MITADIETKGHERWVAAPSVGSPNGGAREEEPQPMPQPRPPRPEPFPPDPDPRPPMPRPPATFPRVRAAGIHAARHDRFEG